ncbi:hypothetical protein T484DRAFT_1922286, partial [Baffinella frigidus]
MSYARHALHKFFDAVDAWHAESVDPLGVTTEATVPNTIQNMGKCKQFGAKFKVFQDAPNKFSTPENECSGCTSKRLVFQPCPNACEGLCGNICLYTDIQLAKHLEVCNESERECWFKDSGCTRLLKGRDMVAHLKVCGEEE